MSDMWDVNSQLQMYDFNEFIYYYIYFIYIYYIYYTYIYYIIYIYLQFWEEKSSCEM